MNITRETVLYVARLARLRLSDEEVPRMQRDLDAILGYVATLREVDTSGRAADDPRARDRDAAAAPTRCATCCRWPRWCATRRSTTRAR